MLSMLFHLLVGLMLVFELAAPIMSLASSFTGKVVGVIDGDTIDVLHNGQSERIRLNGIDCPEKGQAFGKKAKQFTSEMVFGKDVTVQSYRLDRYGRTIADILLADATNLNRELVKAGLAWRYVKYSKDEMLSQLEADARDAKRGLWVDTDPMPPWEYRHPTGQSSSKGVPPEPLLSHPAPTLPPSENPAPIIGNRNSSIYHRPDCPNYTATAPKNRIIFKTIEEAESAGYVAAGNCPVKK